MNYDVAIVGAGPAGLTAGIYTSRARLKTVLIEGPQPGGQLMTTTSIENWPGSISIMGPDLMINMRSQAESCGCELVSNSVSNVDFSNKPFTLTLDNGQKINARSVIIATGASHRKLGCVGENEYFAKGVSVCATCDAPFFAGKDVVIVGGGDSAMTEAEHLTHLVKKLTVVHILDKLTGKDPIKDKVLANPKVDFLYNSEVKEIKGDGQKVTSIVVENKLDKSLKTVSTDGVFVAIGLSPNSAIFKGQLDIDSHGYIVVKDHVKTSVEGVFVAGDVADYRYRQAVTSAGTGCMAALDCQAYLNKAD